MTTFTFKHTATAWAFNLIINGRNDNYMSFTESNVLGNVKLSLLESSYVCIFNI